MKMIHKFVVPVDDDVHDRQMPEGARIVHVDVQRDIGEVKFWAEVDTGVDAMVTRSFTVYGTGSPILESMTYVGTVLVGGGRLVWHLYEVAAA